MVLGGPNFERKKGHCPKQTDENPAVLQTQKTPGGNRTPRVCRLCWSGLWGHPRTKHEVVAGVAHSSALARGCRVGNHRVQRNQDAGKLICTGSANESGKQLRQGGGSARSPGRCQATGRALTKGNCAA